MKTLSFSFIIFLTLTLSIPLTNAGWANVAPKFIPINGQMCQYKETVGNTSVVYEKEDCLTGSDSNTFKKFRKGGLLFGQYGKNMYVDKNALYFHPVNGEWERIEMNTDNISKKILFSNYFSAGNSLYYNGLPLSGIIKVGEILSTTTDLMDKDTIIIKNELTKKSSLYYQGALKEEIDAKKIYNDTYAFYSKKRKGIVPKEYPFFISGSTVYIPNIFTLDKIDGVDLSTWRKTRLGYEDKNNSYIFEYGHYGFEIKVKAKD